MDPATVATPANIAIAAITFIGLEISAGGLKEIGKEIYGKVKESLKPEEMIKLDLFEKYPESKELKGEVAEALIKHLEADSDLASKLDELLQKAQVSTSKTNINIQKGKENYNIQDSPGAKINRGGK